ncbi:hypothetical protein [Halobacillus litoralis]|uniref:hypothetical protein n=1 Tax=Halobacillus litoralis TaxID=45668 RepID=UPI001CFEC339|nr:hypothetical protein [Halobacillus litoralis]
MTEYAEEITVTFKRSVFAFKNGLVKKSLLGYFYGGLVETFKKKARSEMRKNLLRYDWIEGGL